MFNGLVSNRLAFTLDRPIRPYNVLNKPDKSDKSDRRNL